MKITRIQIKDFLGIKSLDLDLRAPINLIVGENEAGKSSVRDAVQWCLTGQARGLKTQQEQAALIRNGGKAAAVAITLADGNTITRRKTPKSASTLTGDVPGNGLPAAVLCNPYTFLSLPENQRRELLFKIIPGLNPTRVMVTDRIEEWLADAGIELVPETQLTTQALAELSTTKGFAAAATEAIARRREAKRLREHLGGISPPSTKCFLGPDNTEYILPDIDTSKVEKQIKHLHTQRDELIKIKGRREASIARVATLETELTNLKANLKKLVGDPEADIQGYQAEINRLQIRKANLETQINAYRAPEQFPAICPAIQREQIPCPRAGESVGDAADPTKIEEARKELNRVSLDLCREKNSLKNIETQVKNRKALVDQIARLEKELSELQEPNPAEPENLEEKIAGLENRISIGQELLARTKDFWTRYNQVEEIKRKMAGIENEIELYDILAKALAPDGIPSQMIAEALGSVNKLLETAAAHLFPGRSLTLSKDLGIELSGSPYITLSKSAKFRVGIGFQYALARMASARLLMIDEADILDPSNRACLTEFLMAVHEHFETILVFATSNKAFPYPSNDIQVWWINNGKISRI